MIEFSRRRRRRANALIVFREPGSRAIRRLWGAAARDFRLFGNYTRATLEYSVDTVDTRTTPISNAR